LTLEIDRVSLSGLLIKTEVNMVKNNIKKVHGIGVNNADYAVTRSEKVNGKWKVVWVCPYYTAWKNMLERCYYEPHLKKRPTYRGCSACPEWIYFMTFRAWMMTQDFEGKQLDKDILIEDNKVYSPETCRFVDNSLNMFLTDRGAVRGEWPLGVNWHKRGCKFQARCNNPLTKKREHLGFFTCPNEAHEAWRKRKHEIGCQLAELQKDPDIAKALRSRFAPK
jgi:hypothetical protein